MKKIGQKKGICGNVYKASIPQFTSLVEAVSILRQGQLTDAPSVTTKLPFPYHLIPGEIRMILRNILFRPHVLRMRRANGGVEPEPYADNAVDLYLAALDYDAGHAPWFWAQGPAGCPGAVP